MFYDQALWLNGTLQVAGSLMLSEAEYMESCLLQVDNRLEQPHACSLSWAGGLYISSLAAESCAVWMPLPAFACQWLSTSKAGGKV